jgi:hypothetical protein
LATRSVLLGVDREAAAAQTQFDQILSSGEQSSRQLAGAEERATPLVAAKAACKQVVQLYNPSVGGSAIGSRRELAPAGK